MAAPCALDSRPLHVAQKMQYVTSAARIPISTDVVSEEWRSGIVIQPLSLLLPWGRDSLDGSALEARRLLVRRCEADERGCCQWGCRLCVDGATWPMLVETRRLDVCS